MEEKEPFISYVKIDYSNIDTIRDSISDFLISLEEKNRLTFVVDGNELFLSRFVEITDGEVIAKKIIETAKPISITSIK